MGSPREALEAVSTRRAVVDPAETILGSALRRALPFLLEERELRYDPDRPARMNDLIVGEIVQVPRSPDDRQINFLERLYPDGAGVRLRHEAWRRGPCIGVVGNRYAPPYLIGGLTDPLTGRGNGQVRGRTVVEGLFGTNVCGFANYHQQGPEERVRILVRGVAVDRRGQALNLTRFREAVPAPPPSARAGTRVVVVAGHSTDAGKTTAARALAGALRRLGFRMTVEKKTGTACCRDWLRCFAPSGRGALERAGDEVAFSPDEFPARDFVDGLGSCPT